MAFSRVNCTLTVTFIYMCVCVRGGGQTHEFICISAENAEWWACIRIPHICFSLWFVREGTSVCVHILIWTYIDFLKIVPYVGSLCSEHVAIFTCPDFYYTRFVKKVEFKCFMAYIT